ncbi:hypothetical protein NKH77_00875 [Streptomyces sp. M19]
MLEEPPGPDPAPPRRGHRSRAPARLRPDAARLTRATDALSRHLRNRPGLEPAAVAHTLAVGRRHHAHRRAVVCENLADAAMALAIGEPGRVVESPGTAVRRLRVRHRRPRGSGPGRGGALPFRPLFRQAADGCAAGLTASGLDALELLTGGHGDRVAAFVTAYAMASALRAAGVRPTAVHGRGVGRWRPGASPGLRPEGRAGRPGRGAPAPWPRGNSRSCWARTAAVSPAGGRVPGHLDRVGDTGRQAPPAESPLAAEGLTTIGLATPAAEASARHTLLRALGTAWAHGAAIDWSAWYGPGTAACRCRPTRTSAYATGWSRRRGPCRTVVRTRPSVRCASVSARPTGRGAGRWWRTTCGARSPPCWSATATAFPRPTPTCSCWVWTR